jgi:GTP-binding protein
MISFLGKEKFMNVNNVSLVISAVKPEQYPKDNLPEIVFAGRSNVGKSSLINKLVNRKSLARTSSKPGKTATINFYNVEDKIFFVDLPGYGYAKVSKVEKEKWGRMIEKYLSVRSQIKCVIQLVDARHKPTQDDYIMVNWARQLNFPVFVIATKWDKLKKSEREKNLMAIKETLHINNEEILLPFSAETGEGKDEIWEVIDEIIKNY